MELYSMPQLDKTSPVYSDAQFEGGGDNINNQRTSTTEVKKYAAVSTDTLPLLTSSASWNAVVHHPAEEDSEVEDLPSTVDMEAIKGSPATPLAASKTPPSSSAGSWTQSKVDRCKREGAKEEAEASDSEDSDGEDESDSQESDDDGDSGDSDSVNGSGSDSEGSESESCSWTDSDSESGSSSCSSRSGHSSRSSHTRQTFSIRETNFEQGGLKLKIAAMKVTKKASAKDSIKEAGKEVVKDPAKDNSKEVPKEITKELETKKASTTTPAVKPYREKTKVDKPPCQASTTAPSQSSIVPSPSPVAKASSKIAVGNVSKKPEATRRKLRGGRNPQKEKVSNVSGRNPCSMRVPASPTLYGCTAAGLSRGRTRVPHTPHSNTESDESESDEDEEVAEISQIAQELGHIEQGNIAISEHLQEINQEDLAAILPDVVTTDNHDDEAGPPFEGFEDVSSESGKVAADGSAATGVSQRGTESSSDMELPEQVVSEAIKRIHIDSEEVQMRGNDSSSGEDSCDGEGGLAEVTGYSSALLQQFVEKTEILASQATCSQDTAKVSVLTRAKREEPRRRKRGRPPKNARKVEEVPDTLNQAEGSSGAAKCMPELEAYMRLDCSVSNVSPDSGIQSVAGSPVHHSCSPASHVAIHSPGSQAHKTASPVSSPHCLREATPPPPTLVIREERPKPVKRGPGRPPGGPNRPQSGPNRPPRNLKGARRGPGRPKGSLNKAKAERQARLGVIGDTNVADNTAGAMTVSGNDSCDEIPPTPSPVPTAPIKRGPGRPKKAPPVLEPNLPIILPDQNSKRDGEIKSPSKKKGSVVKVTEDIPSSETRHSSAPVQKQHCKGSVMLSEICERVSKRLDQSSNLLDSTVTVTDTKRIPSKFSKTKGSKELGPPRRTDGAAWPKSNKGRRKREKEESTDISEHPSHVPTPKQKTVSASLGPTVSAPPKSVASRTTIPRVFSLPGRISHHKHKKRKKKSKPLRPEKSISDPAFLMDLEKLALEFSRCTISKGETLGSSKPGEVSLPSIFRVKRIVKKRKGSEKSRASDRESGTEGDGGKEKSRQRRPKKSMVEAPKGHERPEANNEQRLPLKKRHYHISTATNLPASSSSPETPRTESSGDNVRKAASSERTLSLDKDKPSDKVNVGNVLNVSGKNQSKPSDKAIVNFKEKPGDKGTCIVSNANKNSNCNSIVEVKSKAVSELPRNSIDEAIEACITRYTTTSPPLEKSPVAARTVIVTPKKRHRLENVGVICASGRTANVTTFKGKDSVVDSVTPNNNNSKNSNCLGNSPQPGKRSGSRSASVSSSVVSNNSGTNGTQLSPSPSVVESKSPIAPGDIISKAPEGDEPSIMNSVIKATTPSPVSKPASPVKAATSSIKCVPVSKIVSPEKKAASSVAKGSQPPAKTNLPVSKTTSPASKSSSLPGKVHSPNKISSAQINKGLSPNKVSSPTNKLSSQSCLASKLSSPSKVIPNNANKGIVPVTRTASSPTSKVVSASSRSPSPSKRTKTLLPLNKSPSPGVSPTNKTSSSTTRIASPTCKTRRAQSPATTIQIPSVEKVPSAAVPVTKVLSTPAKVTSRTASSSGKSVGTLQSRTSRRANKIALSSSKVAAAKALVSGKLTSPRTISVCNRTLLSARRSIGLGRGSAKGSAVVSRASASASKGTSKTMSKLHSSPRSVEDSIPVFHNLRVKRANGVADKDDLLFKRNKKKRLIRDVRVHVTKLSPMDLLKKAVGAVKERARRRKSINRTGFPVKKKKKKRPQIFEHNSNVTDTVETATSTHVQITNESPLQSASVPAIDSELKTVSEGDNIEIVPVSTNDSPENECDASLELQQGKRDQSSVQLESNSKPKVCKSDSLKEESVDVSSSELKSKETSKRDRLNSVLPSRGDDYDDDFDDYDDDDDDTDTESDLMIESRPLGSCRRYKGDSCQMVEDRTDEELSVCAADDSIISHSSDNKTRSKRKRDTSHDEANHSSLPHTPSKRLRKIRDYEMDRDDLSHLGLPYESLSFSDVPSGDESTKSGRRKKQPRWRKKFLAAGLFSDYFKEDEPRRPTSDSGKSRLLYRPEEHQHGLLPPPYHCGKYLRQRRVEFKLPYDLWWLHTHSQLPGRDRVPSWNYKKIRTNVYYDVKPTYTYEAQACNCALPTEHSGRGCGEECINRMVYAECSPQLCPCRDLCSNQRIQRHEWAPGLEKFMTKDKGWGVKTKYAIKSGEFILEYVGEVVSEKEFKDRMASRYINDTHHYCLNLDGGLVIDGHRMGGDGRFVNHSCEPNCEMQKWSVNGLFRMALFALRDIQPHEELSYDYNFSLFNPAEGQPCKCGSLNCRGVIGGKSQRINGSIIPPEEKPERRLVGRPRKNARKNSCSISTNKLKYKKRLGEGSSTQKHNYMTPVKPMSHQQRCFAQLHHCFLLRNLEKVKRLRERLKQASRREQPLASSYPRPQVKQSDVFLTQLNALSTPRNIRTRRLAQAEDNPELTKTARLAYVFRDLYNIVIAAKDERSEMLCAPFQTLPSKRKLPEYYQRITEPIDLGTLEQNIVTGYYRTVESFDQDMTRLFTNNVRFFGRTSELGITAARLRKVYNEAKLAFLPQLEEILGESPPASFIPERDPGGEEEDVIRCICGLYKDEGMMIQCERCLVWQHCDCVRADEGVEHYLCEQCSPRPIDLEIIMSPQPPYATPGLTYYITLLRGTLQLRQGDTVYVLRDMIEENAPKTSPPTKHTYKTIKNFKYTDFDIFRIERLWRDEKGERFAFGHHYLRPHETYHEPSRKFFPNEVMRVPLYEVVPLDLIMGHCWVLDLNTYCKGRPVGASEEHIYICEYRVDKSAHLFTKIAKPRHSVCTKTYAFETFDTRLKPQRTYTPHGPVAPRSRGRSAGSRTAEEEVKAVQAPATQDDEEELPLARRASQKKRLNMILLRLLARLPSKQPLDLSFLLEPGRRHRKKTSILNP